jgi:PadR family transcriptional regulator PadR
MIRLSKAGEIRGLKEILMKFESQLLKGIAPVVVLEILSGGPMYGYELDQAIEQRSGEILTLGKGTLYPLLYNLEAKKLIKGKWQDSQSGRKRRYYSITGKGEGELVRQKAQLKELTAGLNLVFGGALAPA